MAHHGHVKDGLVVLDETVEWSDGTPVLVEEVRPATARHHPEVEQFIGILPQIVDAPVDRRDGTRRLVILTAVGIIIGAVIGWFRAGPMVREMAREFRAWDPQTLDSLLSVFSSEVFATALIGGSLGACIAIAWAVVRWCARP